MSRFTPKQLELALGIQAALVRNRADFKGFKALDLSPLPSLAGIATVESTQEGKCIFFHLSKEARDILELCHLLPWGSLEMQPQRAS